MTKPRFTPDPLPDGLDPELSSFLQRQFDRINDWWPKDLEDRVGVLEENYSYITGEWPIVDYSYVQVEGSAEVFTPDVACNVASLSKYSEYSYSAIQTVGAFDSISFSPDGLKLFAGDTAAGTLARGISQFNLTTAFDVSTATHIVHKPLSGGGATFPIGIYVHPDGDRVYALDGWYNYPTTPAQIRMTEYALSTPFDISTIASSPSNTIQVQASSPDARGMTFSHDGLHFYLGRNVANSATMYQWDMSTPWDITTATFNQSLILTSLSGFPGTNYLVYSLEIDETGNNFYVNGQSANAYKLALSTACDISTASYVSTLSCADSTYPYGMHMGEDCTFFVASASAQKKFITYEIS